MKILLIEDSKTLSGVIGAMIQKAGYEFTLAETGELALQLLEEVSFDLIITDVDMPGLGGFDTVRLIREMLGEHWIPIIFLTSRDTEEDFAEGFDAGGDDYMVKPVCEPFLIGKVRVMERFINMQNQLYELVNHPAPPEQFDSQTGCYNSHTFIHMCDVQLSVSARRDEPTSLLLIDIDYFTEFRELYGKEARDRVLIEVARSVKESARRPNDFIGRLNKNDFVVMLPATSVQGAVEVAERIFETVEMLNIEHSNSKVSGTVSVSISGVCANQVDSLAVEDLLNRAQALMHPVKYRQKDDGYYIQQIN